MCDNFEREQCKQIERAPYVCNSCEEQRNKCPISTKYNYDAKAAQRMYLERLVSSREGINLAKKELHAIDAVVKPLSTQGQSPYMIIANHPELGISVNTLYNYINQGVLLTRIIDLKRKVKFNPRCVHKTQIKDRSVFVGRTYNAFKASHCVELDFWEMDTVKTAQESKKCILTLYFPETELLWAHLLYRCTPGAVKSVINLS